MNRGGHALKTRSAAAVVGTIAISAATIVASPGSAFAAPDPPDNAWDHVYSAEGVVVYVEEHGDIISVCDAKANGYGAAVSVNDYPDKAYDATVTAGFGSCTTHRASQGGNYDLNEGDTIWLVFHGGGVAKSAHYLNDH